MPIPSNRWLALCVAIALAPACSPRAPAHPPPSDEAEVRNVLGLPPGARLVSLHSDPVTGGTFGREGLRIVAELEIPPAELATFRAAAAARPRWSSALPSTVPAMRDTPIEITATPNVVLAYCETGSWVTGTTFATQPCDPLPARYDRYRVAVLDGVDGHVYAVFKNYY